MTTRVFKRPEFAQRLALLDPLRRVPRQEHSYHVVEFDRGPEKAPSDTAHTVFWLVVGLVMGVLAAKLVQ